MLPTPPCLTHSTCITEPHQNLCKDYQVCFLSLSFVHDYCVLPARGSLRSLCQKVLSLIVISEWGVLPGKAFLSIPLYTSCVSLDSFSLSCLVILQLIITPTLIFVFLCAPRNGMCSSRYPVFPAPSIQRSVGPVLCVLKSHTSLECLLRFA